MRKTWLFSIAAIIVICLPPEISAEEKDTVSPDESFKQKSDKHFETDSKMKIIMPPKDDKREEINRIRKGLEKYSDNPLPITAFLLKKVKKIVHFRKILKVGNFPIFFYFVHFLLTKMIFYDNIQ